MGQKVPISLVILKPEKKGAKGYVVLQTRWCVGWVFLSRRQGDPQPGRPGISAQADLVFKKVAGQVLYHRIADQGRKNHFGGGEPGILQHSCPVPGIPPGSGSAGKKPDCPGDHLRCAPLSAAGR